ncbi:unnamed protein product [Linum trigynum]|uniref:Uncharacterized protein n=1 Tax=Linum trigynum TaxID=586398 RepID=A0AAV2DQB3_9ROSI
MSEHLQIPMTQDLGKYLGVPVLHGRVTKHAYKYIIDRIDQRIAGWKAEDLSLAGRVTLAISVLNAIPSYVIQTSVLPAGICDYLDHKIRAFIWGSQEGRRRIHLINWEMICLPKDQGGLGLRNAWDLNTVYFLKLAWGILKQPGEVWVRVFKEKYLREGPDRVELRRKTRCSQLWRGVRRVWGMMLEGVLWSIRDGEETLFWQDKWVDGDIVLANHLLPSAWGVHLQASVASMTTSTGEWNSALLSSILPNEMFLQVIGMSPPQPKLGKDELVWGLEDNGKFTLKSAYQPVAAIEGD